MKKFLLALSLMFVGAVSLFVVSCGASTYSLTFNTDGGAEISAVEVQEGEEYTLPVPTREGYSFEGWYLTADFSGDPVTTITASGDTTFYAKWEQLSVITLDLNGGSLAAGTTLYLKSGEVVYDFMQDYIPAKEGFVFGAWFDGEAELARKIRREVVRIQRGEADDELREDAEREADRVGLQTLYSAGFDPKGMEGFFARLQASNHFYESAAPAYLSTHPLTVERMADMENRTRQLPTRMHRDDPDFRLIQLRAEVLQETTIDGRQRLLREFGRRLKSAKGKEVYALQYGISVVQGELGNRGAARRAAEASIKYDANSAILTRNLIRTRFDAAQTQAEKEKILGDARAAASRFPLSAMMQSNVIDLLYALGRHEEIIRTLRSGSALSDADPDYHALLARSYEALGKRSLQYQHTGEMYALLGATEAAVYQYSLAQKANDGDFYTMSEIDARLRELRAQHEQELKDRNG